MKREGNDLRGFKDFCTENVLSHGHNLALTVLFVPSLLAADSLTVLFMTISLDPEAGLDYFMCAEFALPTGRGGGVPGSV